MNTSVVAALYIYPIKSLAGISVSSVKLNEFGFVMDREWMLVDEDGLAFTQRNHARLALFQTAIERGAIVVRFGSDEIRIPIEDDHSASVQEVQMWGVDFKGSNTSNQIDDWFSKHMKCKLRLVRNYKAQPRIDTRDATAKIKFVDACQCLVIGEASLAELNARCPEDIPMDRFRPNVVVAHLQSHQEDSWGGFNIGEAKFRRVKSCARCNVTTIDQQTGKQSKEPLKTLAAYRNWDKKIWFGSYFTHSNPQSHIIKLADSLTEVTAIKL